MQRLIRFMPKVVVVLVNRWTFGGRRSRHVVCDLSLPVPSMPASSRPMPMSAPSTAASGRRTWLDKWGEGRAGDLLLGRDLSAEDAYRMGMVNRVVPHAELETVGLEWAKIMCGKARRRSGCAFAFNAIHDG